ncbi:retrotransposon protein, putative, ty1-copia subclass [Tanacetum coccineum]
MTTTVVNNSGFKAFFEKQNLSGPNFMDWYRQLRIVLSAEDKLNYLELRIPAAPVLAVAGQQVPPETLASHSAWVKGQKEIDEEGQSVSSYALKMKGYIDNLERLGHLVSISLAVSLILVSLRKEYDSFVQNYNMHGMGKTVNELHAMLKLHEQTLPKRDAPALHAIRASKVQKKNKNKKPQLAVKGKNKGKGNSKLDYAPKPKIPPPPKKEDPAKDSIYHHCGDTGHWKWNCVQYISELLKNKKLSQGASTLGIFTIELFTFPVNIGYTIRAVGLISVILLRGSGENDNSVSVSKDNLIYFNAVPRDDVFEIILSDSNTNVSSMYAVSNKRAKLNLDSSLSWHCRLGHISKKRIEKLQHDGLLNSIDSKSFKKCIPCLSGKMARKPYSHQVERVKDLLGLIHPDVCGPFRIVSRQGARYFVTFTDDFSCYGYVYPLKHKNEVFETFKVFQKEVENQLGKTIKSLHSDHAGKYMSQEFLDHLKEYRIIAHRTPPYTPQHNDVFERRYRTLLDMVLSMMSQTTLLKYFWDYALEFAAHILNMVPTNKVERHHTKYVFVARNAEFFENSHIIQKSSGNLEDLKIIQEEDKHPSKNTSLHLDEDNQEIDEPQSDIIPIHRKIVGSKWIFKKKNDMDGAVHTYKACFIAKGFTQTPGIDYEETLSHVEDIRAIRILISIVAFYDYEIWQMNVKTAFFNENLFKEQASRQWNKWFDDEIKKFGFTQNCDKPCVYMKASASYVTFLILYVDDILIIGNNIPMLQDVKSYLGRCFAMKYLGEAAYIFGIKIYRDRSKRLIGLCQSAYIEKILKRYFMENSKRRSIPMQEKFKLSKSQGASTPAEVKRMQNVPYASANPGKLYWTAVKNILKYLRNTKDMFLVYGGDIKRELRVSCYTDAGYLMDADDLKSQTRYVFVLNGGVVDWKSTKQSIIPTSSREAEYIAASDASKEAVWVRKFIVGLGVVPTIEKPIKMYCDNTGAITIANKSRITKGARHYRAKVHYLREVIEYGDVKLEKVHTDDNLADPFTKSLAFSKHLEHTKNIGMLPPSNLM